MKGLIALAVSLLTNIILFGLYLDERAGEIDPAHAYVKYAEDSAAYYMRGCRYGTDYPEDWRNYSGPGFNVKNPMAWCSINFVEFIKPEIEREGEVLVNLQFPKK